MASSAKDQSSRLTIPGVPHHGEAIQRMTTKSAMSPMLWLLGIALTTLLPAVYLTTGHVQEILTYLVAIVVISGVGFFAYFALRDPDRLQSEEYLTEIRRISLLRESGKQPTTIDLSVEQEPNVFVEGGEVAKIDGR
ncbi:hypothetical protein QTA58_02480 [Neorhizobium sp. CSC1952]|uniref:hypothetical protein n=1 Tax=Neorhizobium sp. CSC1952 TaxID=2978974 RepID=UPI0025A4D439|nr:hypothetical protein [Rhizobium sp. CSC1952]WJR67651.1 hypothetical protein QTA58_02480 [Rhizobium sp. CSC1952]